MADQADVENALVALAAAALYPGGNAAISVTGQSFRVYRGWPGNTGLEADLSAGIGHLSVFAVEGGQTVTSRYLQGWQEGPFVTPLLTVSTTTNSVSFGGIAAVGQLAGILVDNDAFSYRTVAGDTPSQVANALGSLVAAVRPALVSGVTVGVAGAVRLQGRVGADQSALLQTRRQRGRFRLTCWCRDPATRDAMAAAVDGLFAQTRFLSFPDASQGRLTYDGSQSFDELEPASLYRRDLSYSVEYPTTAVAQQPRVLFPGFGVRGPGGVTNELLS